MHRSKNIIFTKRSDKTMASSKVLPRQEIKDTKRFLPKLSIPSAIEPPSARTSPFFTLSSLLAIALW